MSDLESVVERWKMITSRINMLTQTLERPAVTLIAVSKAQPVEAIIPLLRAGQRVFGENRVQEAMDKWPRLIEHYPDIELHLIGSLQTNKVKEALSLFNVVQTVDRIKLVEAICKEKNKKLFTRCNQFFVQVNTGKEIQKKGIFFEALPSLMEYIYTRLPMTGFMCIPPEGSPPAQHFAMLAKIASEYSVPYLSMGMSGDYETAIRLGATHVRIGTALFGERKS